VHEGREFKKLINILFNEVTNEFRKNCFLSNYGFFAHVQIPQMRRSLSRQLQDKKFFLPGSIFMIAINQFQILGFLMGFIANQR